MFRQFYSYVLSKINTYFRKTHLHNRNNFLKHLKIKRRESENCFEVLLNFFYYYYLLQQLYKSARNFYDLNRNEINIILLIFSNLLLYYLKLIYYFKMFCFYRFINRHITIPGAFR